jgi:hypothetical protein
MGFAYDEETGLPLTVTPQSPNGPQAQPAPASQPPAPPLALYVDPSPVYPSPVYPSPVDPSPVDPSPVYPGGVDPGPAYAGPVFADAVHPPTAGTGPPPPSEAELADIIKHAQRFADQIGAEAEQRAQLMAAEAEQRAQLIVGEAEQRVQWIVGEAEQRAQSTVASALTDAAVIVERARQQASEITAQAQLPVRPEAVANLSAAIAEFAETSRLLVAELVQLNQSIVAPVATPQVAPLSVLPDTSAATAYADPSGATMLPATFG